MNLGHGPLAHHAYRRDFAPTEVHDIRHQACIKADRCTADPACSPGRCARAARPLQDVESMEHYHRTARVARWLFGGAMLAAVVSFAVAVWPR